MYRIQAEAVIDGDVDQVWTIATDVDRWSEWDPHEEAARLDGPFTTGTTGWSKPRGGPGTAWTITDVEPGHRWSTACALPGGGISGTNTVEQVAPGLVRLTRTIEITGPLTPLFRLWFGPRMRRDFRHSWDALETRVRTTARSS
jgi:hypothetical protein